MHELGRRYLETLKPGISKRTARMELLACYYEGDAAYAHLPKAFIDLDPGDDRTFRDRRPAVVLPIPRLIVDVFTRALFGIGRRPKATFADGTAADNARLDDLISEGRLADAMGEATQSALIAGSAAVVYGRDESGRLRAEVREGAYCTPTFVPGRFPELAMLEYRRQYPKEVDDGHGGVREVMYWRREILTPTEWIVFVDVPVIDGAPIKWERDESQSRTHELGRVPAIWLRLNGRGSDPFGVGAFEPYLGMVDDLNFTASQAGRALIVNLDPVPVLCGVAPDTDLTKGGKSAWLLPKDATATLLESNGKFLDMADTRIDMLRKAIFDAAGIVLPDPERVAGAQSGASLELLAAPQIAKVDELRTTVGDAFVRLLEGLVPLATVDKVDGKPDPAAKLGRIVLVWGAHYPITPTDTGAAAQAAAQALTAGAISRPVAARYLGRFFGCEDVEAMLAEIDQDEARQDKRMTNFDVRQRHADGLDENQDRLGDNDA